MSMRGRWLNKGLIQGGLCLGMMYGSAVSLGFERQQMIGFRCDVGMPFVAPPMQISMDQTQDGFLVSASGVAIQDTPAGEALKLIQEGKWVQAIQAIESLSDIDQGLVLDERGVLRPLSAMKSALIASMPEEGRRAFCKLNDPAANTRLADAMRTKDLQQRAANFKAVVDDYALCDAAAKAAEHLGDIRFEQGRFDEAAAYYRFAAEHPASQADDPGLIARQLAALSRARQWSAFDQLAEYARFRHSSTTVQVAGSDTPLQSLITQLLASRGEVPANAPDRTLGSIALPTEADLEYSRALIDENQLELIRQLAVNNSLSGIIDRAIAPLVATDGQRVFTLAMGSVARLNPETGTELWQVGNTDEAAQALTANMYQIAGGYHQSLVLHGDTLLVARPVSRNITSAPLIALDVETGQERWNLNDQLRRTNEGVVGTPLVIDDKVYFVTYRSSLEMTLRVVRLVDGAEVGSVLLGKASKGANMPAPAELSPKLTMGQANLLVQTNNGALIAVDPSTLKINWALSQKIRPSGVDQMRQHGMPVLDALSDHTGDVIAIDGLIVAKDTRTNQVVALREYDAAMVWVADTDADATIVHHDAKHIYILGKELVALDRLTGERVWWTPHPGERSGTPLFTKDACLIAGNQRLCRIDLATGKLTHYREDLDRAAALHVVGQQLLCVSDFKITAIRLP